MYYILNVTPKTEFKEIRNSFKKLSKTLHPDVKDTGSHKSFLALGEAYETLKIMHGESKEQWKIPSWRVDSMKREQLMQYEKETKGTIPDPAQQSNIYLKSTNLIKDFDSDIEEAVRREAQKQEETFQEALRRIRKIQKEFSEAQKDRPPPPPKPLTQQSKTSAKATNEPHYASSFFLARKKDSKRETFLIWFSSYRERIIRNFIKTERSHIILNRTTTDNKEDKKKKQQQETSYVSTFWSSLDAFSYALFFETSKTFRNSL